MMPDDDDRAELDQSDSSETAPRVPRSPDLPSPPDIQFTRPRLGQPASDRDASGSLFGGSGKLDAGSAGRVGAGMSAGLLFAASILVGIGAGTYVDRHWPHFAPWGTIVLTLGGMAAGFLNLYRLVVVNDRFKK